MSGRASSEMREVIRVAEAVDKEGRRVGTTKTLDDGTKVQENDNGAKKTEEVAYVFLRRPHRDLHGKAVALPCLRLCRTVRAFSRTPTE